MKIYAPNRAYGGVSAGVQFKAGVGETDNPAALTYFTRAGYGIGERPAPPAPPVLDPNYTPPPSIVQVGRPLRDAAVDPHPSDFLPPTNAGLADPHGPLVVSPQIHASETGPIRPGPVAVDDLPRQSAEETALAAAVFVNQQDVGEATADVARSQAEEVADAPETPAAADVPSKSAGKADWVAFAVSQGMDRAEAEDTKKADLQARFGDG